VMASAGREPGRYNLGTGRGTSLNQLAAMVLAKLAPGQKPQHAPAHAGELRFSVADISAAQRALGFAPARTLQQDMDDVIEWVREREATK
jgi:nucleoside-diphosphate-sugar epimerase